jgi:glutathione synthase
MICKQLLWIGDPWNSLEHPTDTTAFLIRECVREGHCCYWCEVGDVRLIDGWAHIRCRKLAHDGPEAPTVEKADREFDFVFPRVDPPITLAYRYMLQMFSLSLTLAGLNPEERLINPPSVLLMRNDKLLATIVPSATPETLISADAAEINDFLTQFRKIVLKPLGSHQGKGVHLLESGVGTYSHQSVLATVTNNYSEPILAQRYVECDTEKRVWIVNGTVIGIGQKRFKAHGFPPQLVDKSYVAKSALTAEERSVCDTLALTLKRLHVGIAGVDLIGRNITDVNVVSPGLLVEIAHVCRSNLARKVLVALRMACDGVE